MRKIQIYDDDVFVITDVLAPEECRAMIDLAERAGFDDAPIQTAGGFVVNARVRNNTRAILDDFELTDRIWRRVATFVPPVIRNMHAVGLNERIRFYRYEPGQYFAPHTDGYFSRDNGERSFLTFIIYLNDDCEGGATNIEPNVHVTPEAGSALLFLHDLRHESETVVAGRKYVLRTDVMYAWPKAA